MTALLKKLGEFLNDKMAHTCRGFTLNQRQCRQRLRVQGYCPKHKHQQYIALQQRAIISPVVNAQKTWLGRFKLPLVAFLMVMPLASWYHFEQCHQLEQKFTLEYRQHPEDHCWENPTVEEICCWWYRDWGDNFTLWYQQSYQRYQQQSVDASKSYLGHFALRINDTHRLLPLYNTAEMAEKTLKELSQHHKSYQETRQIILKAQNKLDGWYQEIQSRQPNFGIFFVSAWQVFQKRLQRYLSWPIMLASCLIVVANVGYHRSWWLINLMRIKLPL